MWNPDESMQRLPCCSSQPLLVAGGEAAADAGQLDHAAAVSSARRLSEDDLVVDVVKINYGQGDRNPVDSVVFYGRDDVSVVRKHAYYVYITASPFRT